MRRLKFKFPDTRLIVLIDPCTATPNNIKVTTEIGLAVGYILQTSILLDWCLPQQRYHTKHTEKAKLLTTFELEAT